MIERVATHPGEVLREEFMIPLGLKASALSKAIGSTTQTVNELARERRDVSPDMAIRLSKVFATTPAFWMNLQTAHNLSKQFRANEDEYSQISELPHGPDAIVTGP